MSRVDAPDSVSAVSQGDAGTINISWTWSGSPDYDYAEVSYKTAIWHVWDTVNWPTLYKNGLSAAANYTYQFRVRVNYNSLWSDYTYSNYCTRWEETDCDEEASLDDSSEEEHGSADTGDEAVSLADTSAEVESTFDTCDEDIRLDDTGAGGGTSPLQTDFWHYFGDFNGNVYVESGQYKSDDGESIDSKWESKDLDFTDQNVGVLDMLKTIYKVRLWYVDKTSNASVQLSISTDGGATWKTKGKSIGTGDGATKNTEFFFVKSGEFFRFRVENDTDSDDFQWTGLEVFYTGAGEAI